MLKKISLVAVAAMSASIVVAKPASASGDCPPGTIEVEIVPGVTACQTGNVVPTPPAVLAVVGMGLAGLRKKAHSQSETEQNINN